VSKWCQKASNLSPRLSGNWNIWLTYKEKKRADERTRTADLLITNELLYLLSYVGLVRGEYIAGARARHGVSLIATSHRKRAIVTVSSRWFFTVRPEVTRPFPSRLSSSRTSVSA
jgi:hypothetical protein